MSPRFRNTGRVVRAQIVPPSQPSLLPEDIPPLQLARIIQPGASTERYQRTWRVGRTQVEDDILFGRLGFEGSGLTDLWNEEDKDFREAPTLTGLVSPFAIALSDLRLIFQTRGRDIRVNSFTGALRGILRDASGEDWEIAVPRREISFAQWRQTVDRVTEMRFHLEPPNPNYQDRPDLQRLIEGANLSAADIDLRSENGILTDADIVAQLLDHVDNRGYGRGGSVGERTVDGEVVESEYSFEVHGETEAAVVPANPETGEVEPETLREELTGHDDTEHAGEHG